MKRKISSSESSGPDNIKVAKHETPNTSDDDDDDDDDMDSKSMQFGVSVLKKTSNWSLPI